MELGRFVEDINIRYRGTYAKAKLNGKKFAVYISKFLVSEDFSIAVEVIFLASRKSRVYSMEDIELFVGFRGMGYINTAVKDLNTVVQINNSPARQWRRGYCDSSVRLDFPFRQEQEYLEAYPGAEACYKSAMSPTYYNTEEAVEEIVSGRALAVAIAPEVCFGLKWGAASPVVFYKGQQVGNVVENRVVLNGNALDCTEHLAELTKLEVIGGFNEIERP